ncbi:MAG: flagellar basal-body rod protein FlgF [Rhodospirillales bacterium]|jgi:flagellar basal-body rod protein FlgF|nr:flagellar basal-body rod protein FlgF [Rhodospirillales bacterium]HIJ43916.1 flagellar basal-body rod protein FlgF [Rhodospirillaceae bacterium]HIJ44877.1 flagellar basal-body rod protein FlgF [Rhodospirillaceae bacterium]HIJ93248.1 flagellar basal-body rod protein FlgF [Rhodospirillaceae bacterium]HJP53247.1 flagellar basal-body rod protein FlgF [Rhodospirillales bacterium]
MENTSLIALSRQGVLRRQMNTVANNIANMNTTGFKSEKMMFVQHLVRSRGGENIRGEKIAFVRDVATMRDLSEGPLQATGNPLDIAVREDGYLVVESGQGNRYTRNGHLRLDDTGQLVTGQGDRLLSTGDQPFFFSPEDKQINIARDGTVSTENGELGKIKVVRFKNQQQLRQVGGGMFATRQLPEDVEKPVIVQGMLEGSNVNAVFEMTRLIKTQRAYASIGNFIKREDDRIKTMIKELAAPV